MRRELAFVTLCVCVTQAAPSAGAETLEARGRYLATIMDCGGCHTTGALGGKPQESGYLAGADIGWRVGDAGVVYAPNITSDRETGIGSWSSRDIVTLLRTGRTPQSRDVMPIMPWRAYAHMSDPDIEALAAYIKAVPAVHHVVPEPTPLKDVKTPYIATVQP